MPADRLPRTPPAGLIAGILPPAVAAAESIGDLPAAEPGLFPAEAAAVRTAGPRRRAEFAAGRRCARAAIARLGGPTVPLLPGRAGEPLWPAGLTGSITHCAGYRACAVAWATEVAAIGIDAEPNQALPAGLAEAVATAAERAWIRQHAAAVPTVCWDRLLFSAKEAAGKLWYPLAGRWPGFHDVAIRLATTGTFTASLPAPRPGAGGLGPARLTGRWLSRNGLLITAIAGTP